MTPEETAQQQKDEQQIVLGELAEIIFRVNSLTYHEIKVCRKHGYLVVYFGKFCPVCKIDEIAKEIQNDAKKAS